MICAADRRKMSLFFGGLRILTCQEIVKSVIIKNHAGDIFPKSEQGKDVGLHGGPK